jgi:hypothetical protein
MEVAPLRTTSVSATSNTPSSTSSTAVASSSRKTAPIYVSPTWQAGPVASSSSSLSKKPTSKPTSSRTTYGNANNTVNTYVTVGNNDVNCDCSIPAIQKTVADESASKGRKFWNCPNGVCGFFQWVEDAPVASGSSVPSVPAKRPYPPVGRSLPQICPILAYRLCNRRVETRLQTSSCACVNAMKKAFY